MRFVLYFLLVTVWSPPFCPDIWSLPSFSPSSQTTHLAMLGSVNRRQKRQMRQRMNSKCCGRRGSPHRMQIMCVKLNLWKRRWLTRLRKQCKYTETPNLFAKVRFYEKLHNVVHGLIEFYVIVTSSNIKGQIFIMKTKLNFINFNFSFLNLIH